MEKSKEYTAAFGALGSSDSVDTNNLNVVEKFVCAVYGKPKYTDVNKLCYYLFRARYQPKSVSKSFAVSDGIDLSLLPPCRSSLQMHVLRTNYVAGIWKQAHVAKPVIRSPENAGWKVDGSGKLTINWNNEDIMPQDLVDVLSCDTQQEILSDSGDTQVQCEPQDNDPDAVYMISCDDVEEDDEIDNIMHVIFDTEEDD